MLIWPSNGNYGTNCDNRDMLIKEISEIAEWQCWSRGHHWSLKKSLPAAVQRRTLWLGPTIDWTAQGRWRLADSCNQINVYEGFTYILSAIDMADYVMWYRPWVGMQFYSKKGHKSHTTSLLKILQEKKKKSKDLKLHFFLMSCEPRPWLYTAK